MLSKLVSFGMDLPEKAELINVVMARNDDYFKLWEGDPHKTGGLLYHLFIRVGKFILCR